MKNKISKREALIFICEVFLDYAREYADYDDGYGFGVAVEAINNSAGEYITAEDIENIATPYTDALWEKLTERG